jgi:hypothetical protein
VEVHVEDHAAKHPSPPDGDVVLFLLPGSFEVKLLLLGQNFWLFAFFF